MDTSYSYRPSLSFGNQYYNFPVNFSLVSGTLQNGTFASSTTLSSSTHPPGNYRLNNFRNRDLNNLYSDYTSPISNAVTVTNNSGADFVGPNIFNVKVTPSTVNNNGGIITVSYQATDTTGVDTSYSYRPSLSFANQYFNFPVNFSLVGGTLQNGTFASSTTLSSSTHPPGNYRLNNFRNTDLNNFYSDYTSPISNAVTVTSINCAGVNQTTGLDVTQTVTKQDTNSDGNTGGINDILTYNITVRNSGNTTITALDFFATLTNSQSSSTINNPARFVASQNNSSDGSISPGAGATFVFTHVIKPEDLNSISNSLRVIAYPACGGSVEDISDDGDDSDGNTTNDATVAILSHQGSLF